MREGLVREFPEVGRGVGWVRARIAVWHESVMWATISGIGAGFLVIAVTQALVGLASEASQAFRAPLPFPLFPAVTITGSAAAAAIAFGAGGLIALGLYLAYLAVGIALTIPGVMTFCERSGGTLPLADHDRCTAGAFVATLWPELIGIGLGVALARVVVTRGDGVNSLLRVAGALAIAQMAVTRISGATITLSTDTAGNTLAIAAVFAAAAVAAGVVAAQLPGGVRSAAVVAVIWLLPWLIMQVPFAARLTGPIPAENVAPIVVSILIVPIAAALLVLTAAVAARSRFIPREPA